MTKQELDKARRELSVFQKQHEDMNAKLNNIDG
jgi:hypothetical protein